MWVVYVYAHIGSSSIGFWLYRDHFCELECQTLETSLYYSPHQKTAVICFPGIVFECVVRVSVHVCG